MILLRILFIACISMSISSVTYAMTEYQILCTKNDYVHSLKSLIYEDILFKKQLHEYADFLKQTNEKDFYIANVLENYFQQVMHNNREKLARAHSDLISFEDSIRNECFLKDMDKSSVFVGFACLALSASMCNLLITLLKQPCLTDADGVLGGLILSTGLIAAIGGTKLIQEGWNYNAKRLQALQKELKVIQEKIEKSHLNYDFIIKNQGLFL